MSDNSADATSRVTFGRIAAVDEEEKAKTKADGVELASVAAAAGRSDMSAGEVGAYRPGHRTMEGAIASLGLVHPNYFGKRVRSCESGRRISSHRVWLVDISSFSGVDEHRLGLLYRAVRA